MNSALYNQIISQLTNNEILELSIGSDDDVVELQQVFKELVANLSLLRLAICNRVFCKEQNPPIVMTLCNSIKKHKSITSIHLEYCTLDLQSWLVIVGAITANSRIRILNLKGSLKGVADKDQMLDGLCNLITFNESLQILDLADNDLDDNALLKIIKAISERKHSISILSFASNKITSLGVHGMLQECVKLKVNPFEELYFDENPLGDCGAIVLARNLKSLGIAKKLSLSNCNIRDVGAEAIFNSLQNDLFLQELHLDSNRITDGQSVAQLLDVNQTIQTLNLSDNCLDSDAAAFIFDTLPSNVGLKKLLLADNLIDELAEADIISGVIGNERIVELDLMNNLLTDEANLTLINALIEHPSMQRLGIVDISLDKNQAVEYLAKANKRLRLSSV